MSDPNFRLLLEQQLSIFQDVVPPRYALMSGVGKAESHVLKKTTGIEVLSYPDGAHDEVVKLLRELHRQMGESSVVAADNVSAVVESVPPTVVGTGLTTQKQRSTILELDAMDGVRSRARFSITSRKIIVGEASLDL